MNITLTWDPSVSSAPAGFKTAIQYAATQLDAIIQNPINVTIDVGWGETDGVAIAYNDLSSGAPGGVYYPYATALKLATAAGIKNLPATDPWGNAQIFVSDAQLVAWGVGFGSNNPLVGYIGLNPGTSWDWSAPTTNPIPGVYNAVMAAEQELTHALGRYSVGNDTALVPNGGYSVLDLFKYTKAGVLATSATQASYFSLDGGKTNLGNFDTTIDPSGWASGTGADDFDTYLPLGAVYPITPVDKQELGVIGFNVGATSPSAPTPTPPPVSTPTTPPATTSTPPSSPPSATPQQIVTQYYQDILQRAPDPSGLAYWEGQMANGMSSATVEQAFINSTEAQWAIVPVVELYSLYGRAPEQAGLNYWVHALEGGLGLANTAMAFLSYDTQDYGKIPTAASSVKADTTFTTELYKELLGRAPDAGGLNYWVNELRAGLPASDVVVTFFDAAQPRLAGPANAWLMAAGNGVFASHLTFGSS